MTGSGRGIGEAIARGLAAEGALLTIADIDEANASTVAEEIRSKAARRLLSASMLPVATASRP